MNQTLHDFVENDLPAEGLPAEDVVASCLPLLREVIGLHQRGAVAPLTDLKQIVRRDGVWTIDGDAKPSPTLSDEVVRFDRNGPAAVEVAVAEKCVAVDSWQPDPSEPVYLPGYDAWELRCGHHDAQTDVFLLGQLVASLACGVNLYAADELAQFVAHRRNLFRWRPGLHPVIARVVRDMTELRRHKRQELTQQVATLESYRAGRFDLEFELLQSEASTQPMGKEQVILDKLQQRLFDSTRRNRLLHFRATTATVNLTLASVPLSLSPADVRLESLLFWNEALARQLQGKKILLNKYLDFADAVYLPTALNRIRLDARRDQMEYGIAQLRLAVCFLSWTNPKVTPIERYESPLLLVPVELTCEKGVSDAFWLQTTTDEIEVNPVVRRLFQQHFGLTLPEFIECSLEAVDGLYQQLRDTLAATDLSITLERLDRPQVELVHAQALRRLEQYRRRSRRAKAAAAASASTTAVEATTAAPSASPATEPSADAAPAPADAAHAAPSVAPEADQSTQPSPAEEPSADAARSDALQQEANRAEAVPGEEADAARTSTAATKIAYRRHVSHADNPYAWVFDLCNVTLANFRYHRMSLVRDYDALLEQRPDDSAFTSVFRLAPRALPRQTPVPDLPERCEVLPSDPTQAAAIAQARTGTTYIVQGPPGTGKSQTIANLIVDYAASGKRVLFVCAKRAAIDVVFARLKQHGLDDLCCLIHDSQADKKAFVHELKRTYEGALVAKQRQSAQRRSVRALQEAMDELRRPELALAGRAADADTSVRQLMLRAIQLRTAGVTVPVDPEAYVTAKQYDQAREALVRYRDLLQRVQSDGVLARHPLRFLHTTFARNGRTDDAFEKALEAGRGACRRLLADLEAAQIPAACQKSRVAQRALLAFAEKWGALVKAGHAGLVCKDSSESRRFAELFAAWEQANAELVQKSEKNQAWRTKLTPDDTRRALEAAQQLARSPFRWFMPSWWRLRGQLQTRYDFSRHVIQPGWVEILQLLADEHELDARRVERERELVKHFAFAASAHEAERAIQDARLAMDQMPPALQSEIAEWLRTPQLQTRAEALLRAVPSWQDVQHTLGELLCEMPSEPVQGLVELLDGMHAARSDLPRFLDCLRALSDVPDPLAAVLRKTPLTIEQLECHAVTCSLDATFREKPLLRDWRVEAAEASQERLGKAYDEWLDDNATHVLGQVRRRFLENVTRAAASSAGLDADEKAWKKTYQSGRRELEREFGKSMRYRAIRELVSGATGAVVRDLKPVWLMSPLSVADTLPISPDLFDVVVFDEASQITLEESIPTLFRARQAIVVGDEMQLPPTSFFQKRDEEDLEVEWQEDDELEQYDLASESLLNHSARHLPSTMLGWHYRSRNELLIAYSNAVFYRGRLLTIPEEQLSFVPRPVLRAKQPGDASGCVDAVFERPISFHRMDQGVYEDRVNRFEAEYIAQLLRAILRRRTGRTVAIIAFSEAQQTEIEEALEALAAEDSEFRELLETEWEREDDGQFVGLIVKNLENIQGDERDIVILSVCYGPAPDGRMRMLFGPINAAGGERRLNVAFTRAKHHMAVVTSFDDVAITNEHNQGARCLKQYLRYAAAVSAGDAGTAERVLAEFHPTALETAEQARMHPAAEELAAELARHGWQCDLNVGHSQFQVDVAVRRPEVSIYDLAILFDHDLRAGGMPRESDDATAADVSEVSDTVLLEFRLQRPRLLRHFGWNVASVLVPEWLADRDAVVARLLRQLDEVTRRT